MNPTTIATVGVTALGGAIAALRIDFRAFVAKREEDPAAVFDWVLCAARAFEGVLWGAASGLGVLGIQAAGE